MKEKKHIEEEIKYRTEIIKLLALYFLTLVGGEIGLLLKLDSLLKVVLFLLGIPAIIILGIILWFQHKKILNLLKQLREDSDV